MHESTRELAKIIEAHDRDRHEVRAAEAQVAPDPAGEFGRVRDETLDELEARQAELTRGLEDAMGTNAEHGARMLLNEHVARRAEIEREIAVESLRFDLKTGRR